MGRCSQWQQTKPAEAQISLARLCVCAQVGDITCCSVEDLSVLLLMQSEFIVSWIVCWRNVDVDIT